MTITNRQAIQSLRKKLQEANVDSTYTNGQLYTALMEQAAWLIKREADQGKVYKSTALFSPISREVVAVSTVPACLKIPTGCKVYRTKTKLPPLWEDSSGPIVRDVSSADGSTEFTPTSNWNQRRKDPYRAFSPVKYCFFEDGYLWLPEHNPHVVNLRGFCRENPLLHQEACTGCETETRACIRPLNDPVPVPDWVVAEMIAKAQQLLMPSKQLVEDQQMDKNPNRKN